MRASVSIEMSRRRAASAATSSSMRASASEAFCRVASSCVSRAFLVDEYALSTWVRRPMTCSCSFCAFASSEASSLRASVTRARVEE